MKNRSFILNSMIIGALFMVSSCNTESENDVDSDILKVMTWNVWHAGHSESYPGKGCDGVIGILKKSKADIITMVETYGASNKVADSLGYYHRLISSNLSIYSKYPIVETYLFPDSISTFNFGGVMINMNGKKLRIFNTWLHYLPDVTIAPTELPEKDILAWDDKGSRDDEIRKILSTISSYTAQSDSIPVIVSGDFNCHSHLDWTEETKNMYDHNGAVVNWTVSKTMTDNGFTDSFREANPDPTENLGTTWRYGQESNNRSYRIDYIYYKGEKLQNLDSESHNGLLGEIYNYMNENFFYASDHGFVITTFKFK